MKPKHQEHFRRPPTDAFNLGQRGNHLVVTHRFEPIEIESAPGHAFADVSHVSRFLGALAHLAQRGHRYGENLLRSRLAASREYGKKARVDRGCRFAR